MTPIIPRAARRLLAASFLLAVPTAHAATHAATHAAAHAPTRRAADTLVVGIFPFAAAPGDTLLVPLGYALADLLSTDLARSRQMTLVERARLGSIVRELELGRSGAVDTATAPRAGRFVEARTVIVGSLRRRGTRDVVFETHVTDVASGRVDTAFVATAPIADVLAAVKAIAYRLFDHLGVVLTPQERALVEQRPTANLAALLAYGQAVQAEVNGQYAAAARAFRRAAATDPSFTQAAARAREVRTAATGGAVGLIVNQVNRPLETNATEVKPGLATDPAFPGAQATLIIRITRP